MIRVTIFLIKFEEAYRAKEDFPSNLSAVVAAGLTTIRGICHLVAKGVHPVFFILGLNFK